MKAAYIALLIMGAILLMAWLALRAGTKLLWYLHDRQLGTKAKKKTTTPGTYVVTGTIRKWTAPPGGHGVLLTIEQIPGREQNYFITRNWQHTANYCKAHTQIRLRVENTGAYQNGYHYAWQEDEPKKGIMI